MLERLCLIVANHIDFYGTSGRDPLPGQSFGREAFSDREMAVSTSAASAVIEALMRPTPEMLRAMHEAMFTERYDATNDAMLGAGFEAALRTSLSIPNEEGEGK